MIQIKHRMALRASFVAFSLLLFPVIALHAGGADDHTHARTYSDEPLTEPFYPTTIRAADQSLGVAAQFGQWSDVESWPVVAIHTNLLPNGKVLAWDATPDDSDDDPHTTSSFTTRVTLWDPGSNVHIPTNNDTNSDLFCAGSAQLWDGRVLFAGGDSGTSGSNAPLENTNIYHYKTNTWRRVTNMATPRWYASVAALANGEMLTFAGAYKPDPVAEVFQFNETWRPLDIQTPYEYPELYQWLQATPEGNVISFGPQNTIATIDTDANGSWTTGTQRDDFEIRTYGSYAMYDIGKILVSGGGDLSQATESSVIIDTATQQTTTTGNMNHKRTQHDLTILADGSVLAIGGNDDGTYLYSETGGVYTPEIWSPETGQWQVMNDMQVDRQYHSTALLLPDARVLSAGGGICGDCNAAGYREQNGEIFSPPYLFSTDNVPAQRPVITSTPSEVDYGSGFTTQVSSSVAIEKVHLIKLGAATHSQNQEQRLVPLEFNLQGDQLSVQAPADRNLAPPGHYMLFIVDANGVPSIAKIIQVGQPLLRSDDRVTNALLANESDTFAIKSSESDDELVVTLEDVSTPTQLQIQSSSGKNAGEPFACTASATAGNLAQCRVPNRVSTKWLITVQSDQLTDYTLIPKLNRNVAGDTEFSLGGDDFVADRVALNAWNFYEVTLGAEQDKLSVVLSELSADADLYVQQTVRPSAAVDQQGSFYCASYLTGKKQERCEIEDAAGSSWIIGVHGFREASYQLTTSSSISAKTVEPISLQSQSVNLGLNQWQYYRLSSDTSGQQLTVELTDLSGDLDIYLRRGALPSGSIEQWGEYDCASIAGARTADRCTVDGAAASEWLIGVYGYQAASASMRLRSENGASITPLLQQLGKREVLEQKNSSAPGGAPISPSPEIGGEGEGEGDAAGAPAATQSSGIVTGRGATSILLPLMLMGLGYPRWRKERQSQSTFNSQV